MKDPSRISDRYIPELDGLRAIAALAVVAYHVKLPGVPGGFLGVDVFFVLSGYLTASIALSRRYTFREYMVRRLRRLWPLLLCVSSVVAVLHAAFGDLDPVEFLPGAFFLGNLPSLLFVESGPMLHAWTLGVELQFYAMVAALALIFPANTFRAVCVTAFVAITAGRIGLALGGSWFEGYRGFIAHSSGLFLGAVIATLPLDRLRFPKALFCASIAVATFAFANAGIRTEAALIYWITIAELTSAGLIASLAQGAGACSAVLRSAAARMMGALSYGIYLWHYPIVSIMPKPLDPATKFVVAILVSTVLAAITYRLVELPMRSARAKVAAPRDHHDAPTARATL